MEKGKQKRKKNWALLVQTLAVTGLVGNTWRLPGLIKNMGRQEDAPLPDAALPPVTVIVPARNEAANIERCARSLLAQDYPDFELIVVNDGSADATPAILQGIAAEEARLKVVTLDGELPPGWAGKPHAMQMGYEAARPESRYILFSDADTFHFPVALRTAVSAAVRGEADLLSAMTGLELKTFWENVLMPLAIMGIMLQYPPDKVSQPDSPVALANGQFLLLKREAFEAVGGYGGKLKGSLLDDRDMALAVKSNGGKLLLINGQKLASVRMYTGLRDVWQGFRKNAFVGSRAPYLTVPVFVLAAFWLSVLPFLQVPYALLRWRGGDKAARRLLVYSLFQAGLTVYARRRFDRELGVPAPYAWTSPLSSLIFSGILVDSMVRSLTGQGVSWKGRNYAGAARTQQLIK
jgi:chlorobactene glucosyltransferase